MQDMLVLDSISSGNAVNVLGNFSNSPSWFILECTEQSAGNVVEMANLFYESNYFEASQPDLMETVDYLQNGQSCSDDYYFNQQWGLENTTEYDNIDINACDAWEYTKGDSDIIIAVLDSGVKLDHEDLSINSQIGWDIETETSPSDIYWNEELNQLGSYNHGTNCTGIIAAQHNEIGVAGIAPDCEIMPISYNFHNSENMFQRLAKGINHAWQNGADIISCSWISGQHFYIDNAINNAITNGRNSLGTVVVAASGNDNNTTVEYPSMLTGVISVGAVHECGTRCVGFHTSAIEITEMLNCNGELWPIGKGSSYGVGLNVVAPGQNVYTTNVKRSDFTTLLYTGGFGGTSAAAPHVSGVAALLLSVNPDLNYTEVKDAIESTAQKIRTDFYDYNVSKPNGMWNEKLGYGMVDAYAALESVFCHDDVFIESTDNIIWSDETNLCENLIVEGALTINAPVHIYSDLPEITIQNGGHLIFDTGSELYYRDVEDFNGNINVEAGSTLEFKNGSDIVLAENGKIMVNHDSNNSGDLVFNSGASLTLLDDNTNLEIAGDLHIASNATFTFTGDGYIKFSNPGGDAANNIFCGTGASIVLQGSGQNDKIMEV
ncbi:MAG: S8 family serine peptidase [Bacteroidota bacterium]|nr:S8 family serine peptidase [Bacteroidota bacterium]